MMYHHRLEEEVLVRNLGTCEITCASIGKDERVCERGVRGGREHGCVCFQKSRDCPLLSLCWNNRVCDFCWDCAVARVDSSYMSPRGYLVRPARPA